MPGSQGNDAVHDGAAHGDESGTDAKGNGPEGAGATNICTTGVIKLPVFWKEHPSIWFAQVEATFALYKIVADSTKFRYVLVNLDTSTLPFVSDIIESPPNTDKYGALKERLITSFSETNESKLRRLLTGSEFVDEKPSNFLQRLRNLAGSQCNNNVLRAIFLEKMPDQVRSILAISEVADINKIAQQADKIFEVSRPNILAVSHMSTHNKQATIADADNHLNNRIDALAKDMEYMKRALGRSKPTSHARNRSNSRQRENTKKISMLLPQ